VSLSYTIALYDILYYVYGSKPNEIIAEINGTGKDYDVENYVLNCVVVLQFILIGIFELIYHLFFL
jgi:hypothetical protein